MAEKTHDLLFLSPSQRLVKKITSKDPERRRKAIFQLAGRHDPETVKLLGLMTQDANALVRSAAVMALAKVDGGQVYPLVVKALEDRHWIVRWDGADALGELGDARAVAPLAKTARRDLNEDVRRAAVKALGRIGGDTVLTPLAQALGDPNISVAYAAARSLASITGKSFGLDQGRWSRWLKSPQKKP